MRVHLGLVLAALGLVVLAPLATASGETRYGLGASMNDRPAGTHNLDPSGAGNGTSVALPACWANPMQLSAPARFDGAVDVAFNVSSARGTLAFQLMAFREDVATRAVGPPLVMSIAPAGRAVVPHTVRPLPVTGVDRVDVGRASGSAQLSGEWAAGDYRGFCLSASESNSVYTSEGILASEGGSQATIPLPELSGGLLFAMGTALVAGVVVVRRLK